MSAMASHIAGVAIVYSNVCSDTDERKYQSSASLAFVRGIHRGPVNSPHKRPVTRKMFPFPHGATAPPSDEGEALEDMGDDSAVFDWTVAVHAKLMWIVFLSG